MKAPTVSVLMSCYNAAEFLSEAIESILFQTFKDFEFILIDDGSSDETLAIIKDYAERDKRIIVIGKENSGQRRSLNLGIRVAKGAWIARLDADDVALPSRIDDQISFVRKNPSVVLVGTNCIEIDEEGLFIKRHVYPTDHSRLVKRFLGGGSPFPHSSAFFRRDVAVALGGYCERQISEDMLLWLRLSEVGNIACLPSCLIMFRRHSDQISLHNHGLTWLIFGYAARVCHILKSRGVDDPSMGNEYDWKVFVDWLKIRLEQQGCLDKSLFYSDLRQMWFSRKPHYFWGRALGLTRQALAHPQYFLRIAQERFFGSNLTAQLADEWIRFRATS